MVVEGTACDQRSLTRIHFPTIIPINPIGQIRMLVKALRDLPLLRIALCICVSKRWKVNHLEPIVHTSDEEIRFPILIGVPFDSPCSSTDLCLNQRYLRLSSIKYPHFLVVAKAE